MTRKQAERKGRSAEYYTAIRSSHWRKVRAVAAKRANYRCQNCGRGRRRLDGHHFRGYAMLGNETPDDIQMLCRSCHNAAHGRRTFRSDWIIRWIGIASAIGLLMWVLAGLAR